MNIGARTLPRSHIMRRAGLGIAVCVVGVLAGTGTSRSAHPDHLRAFREAGCPVPTIRSVKTVRQDGGHADATIYEALCPGGRVVTVTCVEAGCRVDRPASEEGDE